MRILHVGWAMTHSGGVENWLMRVLHHIDLERYPMDFMVHTREECALDEEIRSLGSRVIPVADSISEIRRPISYARSFRKALREYGPYDMIHSHIDIYCGHIMRLSYKLGIPIRIAHIYTDLDRIYESAPKHRSRYYYDLLKSWTNRYSTLRLACSRRVAESAFGDDWEGKERVKVLYYGIKLGAFAQAADPESVRRELGIPEDSLVIGHVGRFVELKNHALLITIAQEIAGTEPNVRLLLIGHGPLKAEIERAISRKGLEDITVLTGARPDVPRLMRAMDIFVMPSTYEGLGIAMVEAQASGLPCLITDTIAPDSEIVEPLIHRLSLEQPASEWARKILNICSSPPPLPRERCLEMVAASPFDDNISMKNLEKIYEEESRNIVV